MVIFVGGLIGDLELLLVDEAFFDGVQDVGVDGGLEEGLAGRDVARHLGPGGGGVMGEGGEFATCFFDTGADGGVEAGGEGLVEEVADQ